MDLIGYLGKKVDLTCKDGKRFSGHVFDVLEGEDSDLGVDSIEIAPLDVQTIVVIPVADVIDITVDNRYRSFDFHG